MQTSHKLLSMKDAAILAMHTAGAAIPDIAHAVGLSIDRVQRIIKAQGGDVLRDAIKNERAAAAATYTDFLESMREEAQKVVKMAFGLMPDKLPECSAVQLGTLIGIITDKFTALRGPSSGAEVEDLTPLADLINRPDEGQSAGADAAPAADQDGGGAA